jgi:hypothetical protein
MYVRTAVTIWIIQLFACMLSSLSVSGVRQLQIVAPLQSLTIADPEATREAAESPLPFPSFRSRFLAKFRIGLQAETKARKALQDAAASTDLASSTTSGNLHWAKQATQMDQKKYNQQEKIVEQAYDEAVASLPARASSPPSRSNRNRYQFVGVIQSSASSRQQDPPIVWYTRQKPKEAKWTVRLIHPHRDAILKDLYARGKIDIFAHYSNRGISPPESSESPSPTTTSSTSAASKVSHQPTIQCRYAVRERSWKNLWNMSLKHFFTDNSGMFWRERRIPSQQLYTDGQVVYESTYRYLDGRNGMHKVSSLSDFLRSRAVDAKIKQNLLQRLAKDVPDLVLED